MPNIKKLKGTGMKNGIQHSELVYPGWSVSMEFDGVEQVKGTERFNYIQLGELVKKNPPASLMFL